MKILLAIDGSEPSYEAARALSGLAPAERLTVLTVITLPGLSYPTLGKGLAKDLSMQVERAMREEATRILDQATSLLPPYPISVTKKVESGNPAEVILNQAKEENSDLVVVGARGIGQFREQMFGSVSHRVMTHAHCSILIIKSRLQEIQHILLPVANQEDGDVAITFLKRHPFQKPVRFTVLHIIPFSPPAWPVGATIPDNFRQEMLAHGEQLTQDIASRLRNEGYAAEGKTSKGFPAICIADEVAAHSTDLILMRTHSRSGISRFLLGSVSHSVIHHTTHSLLLVR